jgi:hypothetical protein
MWKCSLILFRVFPGSALVENVLIDISRISAALRIRNGYDFAIRSPAATQTLQLARQEVKDREATSTRQ